MGGKKVAGVSPSERYMADLCEADDQDKTLCSKLEGYQMSIKDNSQNFLKIGDDEEKKFYSLPRNLDSVAARDGQ